MMTFPIYGKMKFMFQTTNQIWYRWPLYFNDSPIFSKQTNMVIFQFAMQNYQGVTNGSWEFIYEHWMFFFQKVGHVIEDNLELRFWEELTNLESNYQNGNKTSQELGFHQLGLYTVTPKLGVDQN
jgi:hypothetical protein